MAIKVVRFELSERTNARALSRINREGPFCEALGSRCWDWLGGKEAGYGVLRVDRHNVRAHRYIYALFNGVEALRAADAAGLVIDHRCDRRSCVNPAHLKPVPVRENVARGNSHSAIFNRSIATTGCCPAGHPMDGPNAYYIARNGHKRCAQCQRDHDREYDRAHRDQQRAYASAYRASHRASFNDYQRAYYARRRWRQMQSGTQADLFGGS